MPFHLPSGPSDPSLPRLMPFAWGAGARLAVALSLSAALWLAVSWALGWWGE